MVTPAPDVSSLMVSVVSGPEMVVVVLVLVRESVRMLPLSMLSAVILRVLKKLLLYCCEPNIYNRMGEKNSIQF